MQLMNTKIIQKHTQEWSSFFLNSTGILLTETVACSPKVPIVVVAVNIINKTSCCSRSQQNGKSTIIRRHDKTLDDNPNKLVEADQKISVLELLQRRICNYINLTQFAHIIVKIQTGSNALRIM